MSDRLTAEPGTEEFLRQLLEIAQASDHPIDVVLVSVLERQMAGVSRLPKLEALQTSDEMLVVLDNWPVYIPIVTIEELAADTLNWFEDGQLLVGSKRNLDHVAAWRKWNQEMEVEGHGA